ncbi:unnamed protein product, partial [Rotaria magnacalcarata]
VLKIENRQIQTTIALERQNKFLKVLCKNQKKLAKCFARHKIPICLEDDDKEIQIDDEQRNNSTVVLSNTLKYALKLIDELFIDKYEFQSINVKKVDEDPRIKKIYDAVAHKFGYSPDDMSIIWPPIHDSILSKRRNQQKTLHSKSTTGIPSQNLLSSQIPSQEAI